MDLTGEEFGAEVKPGERVEDCDLDSDGHWVMAIDDGGNGLVRFSSGLEVPLDHWSPSLHVALVDDGRAIVVCPSTRRDVPNAWLVDGSGVGRPFYVGDAVQAVLAVAPDTVVVTYFDEGMSKPLSEQGLAAFDLQGRLLRGHADCHGFSVFDCYAAVRVGPHQVGFWPYYSWQLTEWDVASGTERTHTAPETVQGAHAITQYQDRWWFYSPYHHRHTVFEWQVGASTVTVTGEIEGQVRGLPGGRFLTWRDDRPRVIDVAG